MRKFLLSLLCLSTCCMFAQENEKNSFELGVNAGYDFAIGSGASGGAFKFMPEVGKYFNDNFYFGAGLGFCGNKDGSSIPLFIRSEIDFASKRIIPYASMLVGYDFGIDKIDNYIRINPSFGVKVPVSKNMKFDLNFGYTRAVYENGGGNLLGFNVGLIFSEEALNNAGGGIADFFKGFNYSADLEYTLPETEGHQQYSGMLGFRFNMLHNILIEDLYLGVSLGLGRYKEEYKSEAGYGWEDDDYSFSAFARVQYRAKQLKLLENVYPFAYIDYGGTSFNDDVFFSPGLGACVAIDNKHSLDVSFGLIKVDEENSLRIAIGYNF